MPLVKSKSPEAFRKNVKAEIKAGNGKGSSFINPGADEQEIKILDLPTPQAPEK